jgi:DNA repair exonuclease SbcCD ATPase subunit
MTDINTGDDSVTIENPAPAPQQAFADEAAAVSQDRTPNSRMFSQDEVEAIRRQEKDKLYDKISKLQDQVEIFNTERDEQKRIAEELSAKEAEERRLREEEEMSAKELLMKKEDEFQQRINTAQQEWEEKFSALQSEADAQKALLEQERRFQELESYKSRLIAENQENIMPELMDFVKGNSEEEIESAISAVVARTSAIVENIQQAMPQRQNLRGVPATGSTPIGPLENATEQQTFTSADIANMSMEQYAQIRDRLLAQASFRGR